LPEADFFCYLRLNKKLFLAFRTGPTGLTVFKGVAMPVLSLFPNPTCGLLSIRSEMTQGAVLEVYSILGQKLCSYMVLIRVGH